ncbi:MAG TPA: murein biosynthesis integral membrane protein MurJ [Spirochaetia bacterium]|nr:murein biosynthesis integral membrane protein MurJ [Spirochaetia bacterium]
MADENAARLEGEPPTSGRQSTVSTVIVMLCTAGSRLFGYVRQALFNYYFGGSGAADAINAVFNIPNNLRKLFAEGAFSSAFIPVLSTTLSDDPSGLRPRELVRTLVALQLLVLVPLVALSLAFPRLIVTGLLSFSDPDKVAVGTQLMRWMFNYILLVSLSALVMAVLNSHGAFTIPALSPLMFTLATVLSLLFFHGRLGVLAMGVGVFVGGVLQLACQIPSLRRHGYRLLPSFRLANEDFARTARLWVPYLASASIATINQFFAQYFASGLEDGSVSAITNSVMFLQIPIGIFTTSVATVTFPSMSRHAAQGKTEALRDTVSYGIKFLLVLLVPSSVLLCLFGREIIAAAVQRGRFTPAATLLAARTLTGYAVGLVSMGLYTLLQKLFNSYKSFVVPLVSAGAIAALDIVLSLILKETPLRVSGLAYANSAAFTAGMIMLLVLARRRLGSLGARDILVTLGKSVAGSVPMAALLVGFLLWKPDLWIHGGTLRATALIGGVAAAGVGLTVAMYAALKVPYLTDLVRRRRSS